MSLRKLLETLSDNQAPPTLEKTPDKNSVRNGDENSVSDDASTIEFSCDAENPLGDFIFQCKLSIFKNILDWFLVLFLFALFC